MDVHAVIEKLVDGWCERRALRPLSILLPAWTSLNGLTDGWRELWAAMRHARAMYKDELVQHGEFNDVNAVVAELSRVLHPDQPPQDVDKLGEQITAALFGKQSDQGGS